MSWVETIHWRGFHLGDPFKVSTQISSFKFKGFHWKIGRTLNNMASSNFQLFIFPGRQCVRQCRSVPFCKPTFSSQRRSLDQEERLQRLLLKHFQLMAPLHQAGSADFKLSKRFDGHKSYLSISYRMKVRSAKIASGEVQVGTSNQNGFKSI